MKIHDIVTITTTHPYGIINESTLGQTGIITKILKEVFEIKTLYSEYWYTENEFRPATEMEIKNLIIKLLT